MGDITIRRACHSDAEEVSRIIQGAWREVLSKYYSREIVEAFVEFSDPDNILDELKDPQRICWVAETNREIVGFLEARIIRGEVKLDRVMVKTELRRRGIGKALVEELKRMEMPIQVDSALYSGAISFYKKMGFKEVGERVRDVGGVKVKVLLMHYHP